MDFYPRSPCGERLGKNKNTAESQKFLSTLSLRRATTGNATGVHTHWISIHALLAESDSLNHVKCALNIYFYPRSPCGERPHKFIRAGHCDIISIHALLAESDSLYTDSVPPASRFLSTLSLRRATVIAGFKSGLRDNFYPRSPCGERRNIGVTTSQQMIISIHALLAESDLRLHRATPGKSLFLSTLSLRRATSAGHCHV